MFVDGKLVHSKKVILGEGAEQGQRMGLGYWEVGIPSGLFLLCTQKGDGFVDETGLKKLMGIIDEEVKKR